MGTTVGNEPMTFSTETVKKLGERGYTIGKQIGYGSYSNVYRGKKGTLEIAIKVIDLNKATPNYRDKFFPREFHMIKRIKHKYIVLTYDIFKETDNKRNINRAFIFMELAKTDLLSVIEKRGKIDEVQAKVWFHELTQGLAYMHSKNYAHRDLKVENILINAKNVALISDFGFVKETPSKVLSTTYCGSVQYAAPEIIRNTPYDPFAADIWSLGVCLFAALSGHMPFTSDKIDQLRLEHKNVEKKVTKTNLSQGSRSLLILMLKYNEKERIKIKDAVNHDWYKGMKLTSK